MPARVTLPRKGIHTLLPCGTDPGTGLEPSSIPSQVFRFLGSGLSFLFLGVCSPPFLRSGTVVRVGDAARNSRTQGRGKKSQGKGKVG